MLEATKKSGTQLNEFPIIYLKFTKINLQKRLV